mgnify:CR=1 FL=1
MLLQKRLKGATVCSDLAFESLVFRASAFSAAASTASATASKASSQAMAAAALAHIALESGNVEQMTNVRSSLTQCLLKCCV